MATPVRVYTNCFKIKSLPTGDFYMYDVAIDNIRSDEIRKKGKKAREIVARMQVQYPEIFNPQAVYDGVAIMFSTHRLRLQNDQQQFQVRMSDGPNARPLTVQLKFTNKINISARLRQATQSQTIQAPDADTATAINALQLYVRAGPAQRHPNIGGSFFPDRNNLKEEIGGGFELRRGFFQSVRPHMGFVSVVVDTALTAMLARVSLIDFAMAFLTQYEKERDPRSPSKYSDVRNLINLEKDRAAFSTLKKALNNIAVEVAVPASKKNRPRIIKGIVPHAGLYEFENREQIASNVQRHYRETHNYNITMPKLFGIKTGRGDVIPAELCKITPGQFYKGRLFPEITAKFQRIGSKKPDQRLNDIIDGIKLPEIGYKDSHFLRAAGIEIEQNPLEIQASRLDPPRVLFGLNQQLMVNGGAWNMRENKFHTPKSVGSWAVINFSRRRDDEIRRFISTLVQSCGKRGLNLPFDQNRDVLPYVHGNGQAPEGSLQEAGQKAVQIFGRIPDLLLIILPQSAAEIRRAVKRFGDITAGCAVQCVREDKLSKANDQYCGNVALKINIRLGGINSIVQSEAMHNFKSVPTIVMGADVGHPPPGSTGPSIAGFVASHDFDAIQYIAESRVQESRVEMIVDLQQMVENAITNFGQKHNVGPQRIFFYRDGVSEGQYQAVAETEIQAIENAVDVIWMRMNIKAKKPAITFIIVTKRHHIRFFPRHGEGDRSGNCPPGLTTDQGLSSPFGHDFYLLSHAGLLGTSRPSHYVVLRDDNFGFNLRTIKQLSWSLCHVYASSTRSVSIPAPVYYADLVCTRGLDFYLDTRDPSQPAASALSISSGGDELTLEQYQMFYMGGSQINIGQKRKMYFI